MTFHFTFRQIEETSDIADLVNFISLQNLGYLDYDEWVQRTEAELACEQKEAVLAFSQGSLVGDLIYQGHKKLPDFLELKNLRVHPKMRVRDFARFMLRQVEVESRDSYDAIICDTRPSREDVVSFLGSCGYTPVLEGPLYDSNELDISFVKPIRGQEVITIGKNFLEENLL